MPAFKVKLKRYLEQTADIVVNVPDGEAPLENLPGLDDPNIKWVNLASIPLTADVAPVVEELAAEKAA